MINRAALIECCIAIKMLPSVYLKYNHDYNNKLTLNHFDCYYHVVQ